MDSRKYDIFISYRRTDVEGRTSGTYMARAIKRQLEMDGYRGRVFFDYSELSDGEFEKIILPAIEGCRILVLILSRDSLRCCSDTSDWVRREVCHALRYGLKIIPVNPDNLFDGFPDDLPEELNIVRSTQHSAVHMDSGFERDIQAMIDKRIANVVARSFDSLPTADNVCGAMIHIETDLDCRILKSGKELCTANRDGDKVVRLLKGEHKLLFVSADNDADRYEEIFVVEDNDMEKILYVRLEAIRTSRLEEERRERERNEAKRKSEEEAQLSELRRKREEEACRRAAETEAKAAAERRKSEDEVCLRRLLDTPDHEFSIECDNFKCGFSLKTAGEIIIKPIYGNVRLFGEGLAAVESDGKWGFVDKIGRETVPLTCDYVWNFSDCSARVESWGEWGFVDESGREAVDLRYDEADDSDSGNGLANVRIGGKKLYVDKNGNRIDMPFMKRLFF